MSASIAAASVVAKVTRDRMMRELHERFPHYDFAAHKGYVTRAHQDALELHGACEEHRFSYANVMRVGGGSATAPVAELVAVPIGETA